MNIQTIHEHLSWAFAAKVLLCLICLCALL